MGWNREGLAHFDGSEWSTYTAEYYRPDSKDNEVPFIKHLAIASDGTLWFVNTDIGTLVRLNGENWDHYKYPKWLGCAPLSIAVARNGVVWIGGNEVDGSLERALTSFDGETWTVYEDLPFRFVFDIFQSPDGTMWFGTEKGVCSYTPSD